MSLQWIMYLNLNKYSIFLFYLSSNKRISEKSLSLFCAVLFNVFFAENLRFLQI